MLFVEKFRNHSVKVNLVLLLDISFHLFLTQIAAILRVASEDILFFPIERGALKFYRWKPHVVIGNSACFHWKHPAVLTSYALSARTTKRRT